MKPKSGQINNKKGGLKSVLARFCPVIKILRTVPCLAYKTEKTVEGIFRSAGRPGRIMFNYCRLVGKKDIRRIKTGKGGLVSVPAGFCQAIKRLSNVPYVFLLLACSPVWAQESAIRSDGEAPMTAAAVKEKVARLNDKDTGRRLEAISALGKAGTADAKKALLAELKKEKNPHLRARMADAFGAKQDKAATAELVKLAKSDAAGDVRNAAVRALGFSKDETVVAVLIEKFTDEKELPGVRLQAANSLSNYPKNEVFDVFAKALGDNNAIIKKQALVSLYNGFGWDRARVLPHVERMAKDKDAKEIAERYLESLSR